MDIFYRLVLAHLIADFPLQTDKVFTVKVRYRWGVLIHGFIVGLMSFILVFPYLQDIQVWTSLILLWLLHTFQDKEKIIYNLQIERNNLWTFLTDQILHIGAIGLACFGFSNLTPIIYKGLVWDIYWSNKIVIIIALLFVVTYGANVLISYIKNTIFNKELVFFHGKTKYFGILERFAVSILIWFGGAYYFLLIFSFIPGIYLFIRKKISGIDIILSWGIAIIVGFILKIA